MMNPLARALLAAAVLCAPGYCDDLNGRIDGVKFQKSDHGAGRVVPGIQCGAQGCRCPQGKYGNLKLKVALYAPTNTEFIGDRMADAAVAYGRAGVTLKRTVSGSFGLVLPHTRIRTGKDPEQIPERIHEIDDLCVAVKDALAREPPNGGLPIFFLEFTSADYFAQRKSALESRGASKKELDEIPPTGFIEHNMGEAIGKTFGKGLKDACDAAGVTGLPETPLVVIDEDPSQVIHQVAAHEIGHVLDAASGRANHFFDDIADKSIDNVMVTQRDEPREKMLLTAFQVRRLCDRGQDPYLSDEP